MTPHTKLPTLFCAALCLLLASPAAVHAQDAPADGCRDRLIQASDAKGLGLNILLEAIGPEAAAKAVATAQCDVPDLHLAAVVEAAVRAHDAGNKPGPGLHSLYLSPSQRVEIKVVDGGVPEEEILRAVVEVAPWWAPDGSISWDALLRDINARTHLLEAQLATLDDATLVKRAPGAQMTVTLLSTALYIELAKEKHPAVWSRLTSSAAHIDALRLLWERAEAALAKLSARRPTPSAAMIAAHQRIPAMKALYAAAAVKAPAYDASLSTVGKTPAPSPDAGSVAAAPDAGASARPTPDTPDAGAVQTAVVAASPDVGTKNPVPAEPKTPDAAAAPSTPDAGVASTSGGDAATAKPHTEIEEVTYTGWIILGVAVVVPWLWIAVLWFLRRRKNPTAYLRLANRTLAVATLILVFECLGAAAVLRPSNLELLANRWALLLLWPIYLFAVFVVMLSRLDTQDQLAARKLMRKWGKWGGAVVIVLAVVNSIVLAFFGTLASFFLFPSLGIVGLLGVTFLVKLWRTGDQAGPAASEAQEGADDKDPKDPEPEAVQGGKPEPKPDPKPAAEPKGKPEPKSAPTPEPEMDLDPAEETVAADDNPASGMSDDDLIAALEAMDAGSASDQGEVPPDRAELYKLLDD